MIEMQVGSHGGDDVDVDAMSSQRKADTSLTAVADDFGSGSGSALEPESGCGYGSGCGFESQTSAVEVWEAADVVD
jgi:hypothetical protein